MPDMIYLQGGTYLMGDVFGEGHQNERPVHRVTLDGFYLARCAVTVADFRAFVHDTGFKTSAENPREPGRQRQLFETLRAGNLDSETVRALYARLIAYGGAHRFWTDRPGWDLGPDLYWENPGIPMMPSTTATGAAGSQACPKRTTWRRAICWTKTAA
jgi:formylglycine-generating enzyme required for sulfatase activity